jgi:SAM-dependent methyltransferase
MIQTSGHAVSNKVFFEIGTGRVALEPLAYWLAGAEKIITVDLNPLLRKELVKESVSYIADNQNEIKALYNGAAEGLLDMKRLTALVEFYRTKKFDINEYLKLCRIEYISPGDAAKTSLSNDSVDYYTSNSVLEHIPADELNEILKEGNRILKKDGLFIHSIDYSDHYSHTDPTVTPINFLKYDEEEFKKFNNRFLYANRLRHDDFMELFSKAGYEFLKIKTFKNKDAEEALKNGRVELEKRFQGKDRETLSITQAWFAARKRL